MKASPKVKELRGDSTWKARVGGAVRAARDNLKLSQTEVALRSGVDYGTISRLEKGKVLPTLPVLEALADAMFISIDHLVGHKVLHPETVAEGLAPDLRAVLQARIQAEINAFLGELSPERINELAGLPRPSPPDSESSPAPKAARRRRAPRS